MEKEVVKNCGGIKVDNVEPRGIPKEIEKKVNAKNITELVFILDRSGSMSGMEKDTIGGFNSMIEKQKKEEGTVYVSTVLFSNTSKVLHDRVDIQKIEPMTEKDYQVNGCTALLDAIGGAIHHIGNVHKYARKEDVPAKTMFLITTDGMENASREYSSTRIKEMIKRQEEKYGWEFFFVAANIDAVETAEHIGIRKERAANYNVEVGTDVMYCEMSKNISEYRRTGKIRENWNEEIEYKPCVFTRDGQELVCQQIKEDSTINLDWRKRIIFNGTLKPMSITRFSVYTVEEPYFDAYGKPMEAVDFNEFLKDTVIKKPWSLAMYEDTPDPWAMSTDEHKHGVGKNPRPFDKMSDEKCKEFIVSKEPAFSEHLIEKGEIFTAIEGFYTKDNTNAVIEYRKYEDNPFVDIKVTVEFADKNKLVRLCIPIPDGEIVGDGPFVVESKNTDIEIPFQKWIGVKKPNGKILAFINDGIHSARKEGDNLCLILLRGVGYSVHPLDVDQGDLALGARTTYPINRYLPRIDSGRYTFKLRAIEGTLSEIVREAELFNQKTYAINVFPIGTGSNIPSVYTDKPILSPIFKVAEEGGYIFRFYNPENYAVNFTLFVDNNSQKITLSKAEVVSVKYQDGAFIVYHDEMPV